ncbi:MAG: plasmid pRiA4b ORF-3 family protein [Gemmatimonadota bacterium]|nr:plasmid pRiA4b ORF-3 family protein [Gemmatimonadota bacterium]
MAIQDVMGWLDYDLHEFTVIDPDTSSGIRLGIPDEDFPDERPTVPDWEVAVSEYFDDRSPPGLYLYDFGDDWRHALIYEGIMNAEPRVTYPRCVGGANARPPEDCGGAGGFEEFKKAVSDLNHPEHDEYLEWLGGQFDPDAFDPGAVSFDDPRKRWDLAFRQ